MPGLSIQPTAAKSAGTGAANRLKHPCATSVPLWKQSSKCADYLRVGKIMINIKIAMIFR
jgi:hypothetical protein